MNEENKIKCFEGLNVESGTIHVILSISLSPFFKGKTQDKFYNVRLSDIWGEYLDKKLLDEVVKTNIFTDAKEEEIDIEKKGYYLEEFRGIVYDEIFTPIYRLEPMQLENNQRIEKIIIGNNIFQEDEINKFEQMITEKDLRWKIKIKLTKDGLSTVFLEKTIKGKDIKDYAEETTNLLRRPIFERDYFGKRAYFSAFSTYLNTIAIYITHLFLRECKVYQKVAEITETLDDDNYKNYLEEPCKVRYTEFSSFTKEPPPLRNYCIFYHFYELKGQIKGKTITAKEHFDCPIDTYRCEKRDNDNCFIINFGDLLLSLSKNSYIYDNNELLSYSKKEKEKFAMQNLASRSGELCFVESESVIISTTKEARFCLEKGDGEITYDDYWKNIIKGFSLLVECKTLTQIIGRLSYECMWHYRYQDNKAKKIKELEEVQSIINVISQLLSRVRLITTPSNLSRAKYVRDKFDKFRVTLGLPELINNVEKDYNEINEAINTYEESQSTKTMKLLTFLLVPLTLVISIGTVALTLHELGLNTFDSFSNKSIIFVIFSIIGIVISTITIIFIVFLSYKNTSTIDRCFRRISKKLNNSKCKNIS